MKKIILFTILFLLNIFTNVVAQLQYYYENFDQYTTGQQLACQNPIDWTTWSNLPCAIEDPYLSSNHSLSGSKSVVIVHWNDLIKSLENISTGRNLINFSVYIPTDKTGYTSILSKFTPEPYEWGLDCYFDVNGIGRLMLIPGEPVYFNYTNNQWHYVRIVIDFVIDEAQFWFDNNLIHLWQWSQNGTITSQLAANNFYGELSNNELYLDDYFWGDNCLSCYPPAAPSDLIAQQIFNPESQVQLNWQDNSWEENVFKIIRKNGLPNSSSNYELTSIVHQNVNQYLDSNVVMDSTYTYAVLALNIYGYSDTSNTTTITILPLPVELSSFTLNSEDNNVQVNWTTATETNNSGFEIIRSTEANDWDKIGFVPGHGTTTEPQFYSYIDESLQAGKYQYRLKQIDYDGSFEYSKIIEVTVEAPREFSLSQNYPNPFNPITKIRYTIPTLPDRQAGSPSSSPLAKGRTEEVSVTLKVYDVLGREIATVVNEVKPSGEYEVEFNGTGLSSGIYFYIITAGSYIESKKMILLK